MLIPAFQLHLNNAILHGLADVGRFDGVHPSLACATSAGKVFLHSPHDKQEDLMKPGEAIKLLNINRRMTGLKCGALNPALGRDMLVLGTQTHLHVYDVEENADLFFKEVQDGVNTLIVGTFASTDFPMAIVGGNCSILGFDYEGNEMFWTVTGDNVSALAFCDVDEDGVNELLVGSEDYEMRIYQGEEVVSETPETDKVIGLCPIRQTKYGYALANGTIGVYNRATRIWRVKTKNQVMAIGSFDLDGDGVPELISGWSNGRMDVRSDKNGEVIYKDTFGSSVSAIVQADYRMDGREEIICCSIDGEVRGYLPAEASQAGNLMGVDATEETEHAFSELHQRKQELLYQLKHYQDSVKNAKARDGSHSLIPPNTEISTTIHRDVQAGTVNLLVSTSNDTVVKGVVVFAEQIFDGESLFVLPPSPSTTVVVPLSPEKDIVQNLQVKAFVGSHTGTQFHVFEVDQRLPKFAMYTPIDWPRELSKSVVQFNIVERLPRLVSWINSSFNMSHPEENSEPFRFAFRSLRDHQLLCIAAEMDELKKGLNIKVITDNMDVAGEVIQDLASNLGVKELQSIAEFPVEMEQFQGILRQVDEYNSIRQKLQAEMADQSNLVKTLVVKAEDTLQIGNMEILRRTYNNLNDLNRELIMEYTKRSTNHQQLLNALKDVNQMIQKAAKLRVGSSKAAVVAGCREAIKNNNLHSLFKIVKYGKAE